MQKWRSPQQKDLHIDPNVVVRAYPSSGNKQSAKLLITAL